MIHRQASCFHRWWAIECHQSSAELCKKLSKRCQMVVHIYSLKEKQKNKKLKTILKKQKLAIPRHIKAYILIFVLKQRQKQDFGVVISIIMKCCKETKEYWWLDC